MAIVNCELRLKLSLEEEAIDTMLNDLKTKPVYIEINNRLCEVIGIHEKEENVKYSIHAYQTTDPLYI